MIEKTDRNLFVQMLIFVASIFIVDILNDFLSMSLIIVISTVFFIQHIKNKLELVAYFKYKEKDISALSEIAREKIIKGIEKIHTEVNDEGVVFSAEIDKRQKELERKRN